MLTCQDVAGRETRGLAPLLSLVVSREDLRIARRLGLCSCPSRPFLELDALMC